ncbi:hypothetical protein BB558_007631 [Smittium angustum]|uniref:BZIP domain-containing protein n=1 Tax=Smittium angustum TaxID=133377 RepID=A0A2U1IUR0_SMIAN|nr:hypothetical protein BB558_007631 [Smittium angustum]
MNFDQSRQEKSYNPTMIYNSVVGNQGNKTFERMNENTQSQHGFYIPSVQGHVSTQGNINKNNEGNYYMGSETPFEFDYKNNGNQTMDYGSSGNDLCNSKIYSGIPTVSTATTINQIPGGYGINSGNVYAVSNQEEPFGVDKGVHGMYFSNEARRKSHFFQFQSNDKDMSKMSDIDSGSKAGNGDSATVKAERNRAAQRAFRQRKEQYVKDLESRASQVEELHYIINKLAEENCVLKFKISSLMSKSTNQKPLKLSENVQETSMNAGLRNGKFEINSQNQLSRKPQTLNNMNEISNTQNEEFSNSVSKNTNSLQTESQYKLNTNNQNVQNSANEINFKNFQQANQVTDISSVYNFENTENRRALVQQNTGSNIHSRNPQESLMKNVNDLKNGNHQNSYEYYNVNKVDNNYQLHNPLETHSRNNFLNLTGLVSNSCAGNKPTSSTEIPNTILNSAPIDNEGNTSKSTNSGHQEKLGVNSVLEKNVMNNISYNNNEKSNETSKKTQHKGMGLSECSLPSENNSSNMVSSGSLLSKSTNSPSLSQTQKVNTNASASTTSSENKKIGFYSDPEQSKLYFI